MKKLILFGIIMLFFMSFSSAFFPDTHYYANKQSLLDPAETQLYDLCSTYPDHCYSGNILSDVSVIFYFTTFNKYKVTHTPSFCTTLLDEASSDIERACAVGACMHQAQDLHSHTEMVTHSITHTLLPNSVIHSFAEQKYENIINNRHPEIHAERLEATDVFNDCVPLFKRVLQTDQTYQNVDIDGIFDKFVAELEGSDTGYDPSFNNITSIPTVVLIAYVSGTLLLITLFVLILFRKRKTAINWITLLILLFLLTILLFLFIANIGGKAFGAFSFIIKPMSYVVPIGPADTVFNNAVERGSDFLEQGVPVLFNTDASGEDALNEANRKIRATQYIALFILVGITAFVLYANFKPRRRKR